MGTIIIPKAIVRRPGYLYYIDGKGNICEAKMKRTNTQSKLKEDKQ